MNKFVVVGSAPYVRELWHKRKQFYRDNGFKVIVINNAWKVVNENDIFIWYTPSDFDTNGSMFPSSEAVKSKRKVIPQFSKHLYSERSGGTSALNVLHMLLNDYKRDIHVVLLGSDFIYNNGTKTHFYGDGKGKELADVVNGIRRNAPEYIGLNADPLRYGKEWLIKELNYINVLYKKNNSLLFKDTQHPTRSLLPYQQYKLGIGHIKILLLGSANYLKEWWRDNGQKYIDNGYDVYPINNSWKVCADSVHTWLHSADMEQCGTYLPTKKQSSKWNIKYNKWPRKPYWCDVMNKQSVMAVTALYYILNRALKDTQDNVTVAIACNDFIYKHTEPTHFYQEDKIIGVIEESLQKTNPELAGLRADPMRFGTKPLIGELRRLDNLYKIHKYRIYNAGGKDETLLPFEKKII